MSSTNKLELETFAGATIKAWKNQAAKAGLVLSSADEDRDAGDFPDRPYFSLRRFKRNIAITRDHKRIVIHIIRQIVNTRDSNGRPTKKEFLSTKAGMPAKRIGEKNIMQILKLVNTKNQR